MKTITDIIARGFVLILLAILTNSTAWGQFKGSGTANDPYQIASESEWKTFTENINKGVGNSAYYKLTADLSLGTTKDPIETIVGTDIKPFCGNFDGDYHTITINMNRTETYAAPFGVTDGAVVRNLKVEGTIVTTKKFAGGVIAYSNNKKNKETKLINCYSSIHIICDGIVTVQAPKPFDCTHGGLVGQNEAGVLSFENCIFDGWIKDFTEEKKANKCTGFVAWVNNTVNYTNCVMAGVLDVKPNDNELPNSMANFHRLANGAKANFKGTSYFTKDYTYETMTVQGTQAPTIPAENVISRRYSDGKTDYYVPGASISNYTIKYYGWKLNEGTDYLINIIIDNGQTLSFDGINNYGGSYREVMDPVFQMTVNPWNNEEKSGWYAISSPVIDQAFSGVTNLKTGTHNIYRYDEELRLWQEYRNSANLYNSFENGRGYLYRTDSKEGNIGFNGTLNSGDVQIGLSYTEKNDKIGGFNLIGNPYSHVIYKSVAIPNELLAEGYCVLNYNGTWEYKTDSDAIEEGEAVLVQALANAKGDYTLTITDTDMAPTMKASNNEIWFTVKNGEFCDKAHVEFKDGCGYNKMAHYNEDAPMLYIKHNGDNFASANINDDVETFDLCFETKKMANYDLSFDVKGDFSYLHLIDRMTGADVDMLIDETYSFVSSSADDADRFVVRLSYNTISNSDDNFAYQSGNDIFVSGDGTLQVFDVMGRMIAKQQISGAETICVSPMPTGVYVFRLVGNDIKTQKIVVR